MYKLKDTNPTHIATEFVLCWVGFAPFEVLCVFDQFPGMRSPSAGNCSGPLENFSGMV